MPLQTRNLVMAGLGILGDIPPNGIQPPLEDGIHLRWSFKREIAFPWYGYYLFRRIHREGEFDCLLPIIRRLEVKKGSWSSKTLNTLFGYFISDRNLVFTDDFPQSNDIEFDLSGRSFLRFVLPSNRSAYKVKADIGFRRGDGGSSDSIIECISFREREQPLSHNPFEEKGVSFQVYDWDDSLLSGSLFGSVGGLRGLNCGFKAIIALPDAVSSVELTLSNSSPSSPARIEALNADGASIAITDMNPNAGITQTIRLDSEGIVKVIIHSPQSKTLLHEICYTRFSTTNMQAAEIKVTALLDEIPVDQTTVKGSPGQVVTALLESDSITSVEFSSGPAALINICIIPVSQDALRGWQKVPDFSYPLCLPVANTDYTCATKPATKPQAENMAVGRVHYGDPNIWRGSSFNDLHHQLELLVKGGPPQLGGEDMADREHSEPGIPSSPAQGKKNPIMPHQHPLDLIMVGTIHAAIAQMVGLYWIDKTASPGIAYDYLILADHTGLFGGQANNALNWLNSNPDFTFIDGYIVFNKMVGPASPLSVPEDIRAYALPGGTLRTIEGNLLDSTNNAGLRWDLGYFSVGLFSEFLLPNKPVMYHLWRADLGATEPSPSPLPPASQYKIITEKRPVVVGKKKLSDILLISLGKLKPEFSSDFPPFTMHAIDRALPEGWYSYKVSGIDIFGRHSSNSAPAQWYQWTPLPNPTPWYYQNPPSDKAIHPFAVALLDKTPPPPPTGVEAYSLDPNDPTVLRDTSYNAWYASLTSEEQSNVIGLRVRWLWTDAHWRQAPDASEFRIYLQPNQLNALLGNTLEVTASSNTESTVGTDIPNTQPANKYAGTKLRIGSDAFDIIGSQAGAPLKLQVKNIGPNDDIRPKSNAPCTIVIPGKTSESPAHSLFVDYTVSTNWQERYYVVGYNEHVTPTTDTAGRPLRKYEIFIPTPSDTNRNGLSLNTSLSQPVVYAHIGISTADDKTHTHDNPKWNSGSWGNRTGNEGYIGSSAMVFRVHRERPPAPVPPPDSERVYASHADYHSRSFYTYRWIPSPHLKTHIFRALDDGVFKIDWSLRPRPSLNVGGLQFFPSEADDPRWDALKRQQVADELNVLNTFPKDNTGKAQAIAYYRGLSNDALRVLAALPSNERAFAQLTIQPLDPNEPDPQDPAKLRWQDRIGPDNDESYVPKASLRAYVDVLDGRSTNRYFYRAAYVSGAYNQSVLSISSPPVWLPDIVPPKAPTITKVFAGDPDPAVSGDGNITIQWTSNREPDLLEYRIYRTGNQESTRDIRLMTLIHTESVSPGPPSARPAEITWTDLAAPASITHYYRIVAVDGDQNISEPSLSLAARSFDERIPEPPQWDSVEWIDVATTTPRIKLKWILDDPTLLFIIQRKEGTGTFWWSITKWFEADNEYIDSDVTPSTQYVYRLKVKNRVGYTIIGPEISIDPL